MRIVLDNSVTMRWLLDDSSLGVQDYARKILQNIYDGDSAVVPNLWSLEVANVLAKSQKKGLVTHATIREFLTLLTDLDIVADTSTHEQALREILHLAVVHNLSAYDAAYLELALREGLPMATLDRDLGDALIKAGGVRVQIG